MKIRALLFVAKWAQLLSPLFPVLALALLTSCATSGLTREDRNPAPSAYATKEQAAADAAAWAARAPRRSWATLNATGSMVPLLDSRSVVGLEIVRPADLRRHDAGIFYDLPRHRVCHQVQPSRRAPSSSQASTTKRRRLG